MSKSFSQTVVQGNCVRENLFASSVEGSGSQGLFFLLVV